MPRSARTKSASNIYHVILRGINRQDIFEDDGDKHYFMTMLKHYKEISGFKLYAFCLMSNHVHLLMEPAGDPLDLIFKRFGAKYVAWYNRKYERSGHLFQGRYVSEGVDSEEYFRTVLRYILQNPMKAGMEKWPGNYKWTSFRAYEKGAGSITDTEYALELFGGREPLMEFVLQGNQDHVMDEAGYDWRLRDEPAKEIMMEVSSCATANEFQQLDRKARREYVRELYARHLSMGQITRLTGVPKTTVARAVRGVQALPPETGTPILREESAFDFEDDVIW